MKITLIGLGVTDGGLTKRAETALAGVDKIFARTAETLSYKNISGYNVQPLDGLFGKRPGKCQN